MNSMMDYIGSMITGAGVFLMMLSYYFNVGATAISQVFSTTTQEDMTSITEILEHDFRKAGYGVADSVAFPIADTNRIAMRGDFDNNGTIDTVQYWLGDTQMPGSSNPLARILYRKTNGTTVKLTTNAITLFKVWYYNASGATTTVIKNIQFARVALNMECKLSYDNQTAGQYWERVIKPQNVR
jgi:hypothetical protein